MNLISFDEIDQAYEAGKLIEYTRNLSDRLRGDAWKFAKCLSLLRSSVVLEEGTNFEVWASQEFDISPTTATRYANAWELVDNSPPEILPELINKPINTLIPLGTNLANGSISDQELEWDKVSSLNSNSEARKLIRDLTGREERQGTITITGTFEDDDSISLHAWYEGEKYFVGFLVNPDWEPQKKAINRILNRVGIQVK